MGVRVGVREGGRECRRESGSGEGDGKKGGAWEESIENSEVFVDSYLRSRVCSHLQIVGKCSVCVCIALITLT